MQTESFDPLLLSRIEDASLNASAPREQRWLDGWLVRSCPGKAKRARSVQAVAAGRMPVAARVAACRSVYDEAGLQMFFRITPFSLPAGLDDELAGLGLSRVDDTRVMVKAELAASAPPAADIDSRRAAIADRAPAGSTVVMPPPPLLTFDNADADTFADWVGQARESPLAERKAHAARLRDAPVALQPILALDASGQVVAAGHLAIEGELVGLYDIVTAGAQRGRGIGECLCSHLLARAARLGARTAYLQVDAGNDTARRLYRRLGFADAYAYHYRAMPLAGAD